MTEVEKKGLWEKLSTLTKVSKLKTSNHKKLEQETCII
jgi:hypothetical protein